MPQSETPRNPSLWGLLLSIPEDIARGSDPEILSRCTQGLDFDIARIFRPASALSPVSPGSFSSDCQAHEARESAVSEAQLRLDKPEPQFPCSASRQNT